MSEEPTNSSSDVLSLFQPKTLAAIDYIRNVNKQRPDAEAINNYIFRTNASNVNKTDIVNSINELVEQNVIFNKKRYIKQNVIFNKKRYIKQNVIFNKKHNSVYDWFFFHTSII